MSEFVNAVGLLGLTIGANFTGDLFGCGIKKELTENPIVKHGMAYLLLLFFVVLTNKDAFVGDAKDGQWVTLDLLKNTLLVYAAFLAFTKCTFNTSVLIVVVLLFIMLLNIEKSNKDDDTKDKIADYKHYAMIVGVGALVYGLFSNLMKQYNDHREDFSLYKFFIGTTKCDWEK